MFTFSDNIVRWFSSAHTAKKIFLLRVETWNCIHLLYFQRLNVIKYSKKLKQVLSVHSLLSKNGPKLLNTKFLLKKDTLIIRTTFSLCHNVIDTIPRVLHVIIQKTNWKNRTHDLRFIDMKTTTVWLNNLSNIA